MNNGSKTSGVTERRSLRLLNASAATADVTAVFSAFYVPPTPPAAAPSLTVNVSGDCLGCTLSAVGTGFHPNSSITLHVEISSPFSGSADVPNFATTDANGTWSYSDTFPVTSATDRSLASS
jgi:hypothetical protein